MGAQTPGHRAFQGTDLSRAALACADSNKLMAGYTPVFNSIFDGTLHGKWPQTGVWLALLAMTDRHGCIDRTPQAIASDIGISVEELMNCITQFMAPDPMSRTRDYEGRRLVLIDAERSWGWRVVNHARYREKARLQAKDSARTESGADAARKRTPPHSPAFPRSPPASPSPDSNSNTDSNKESQREPDTSSGGVGGGASRKRSAEQRGSRIPTPFLVTAEMRKWAGEKAPHVNLEAATEDFCNYWRALPGQRSRKLDWVMTWKNRMKECEDKAMRSNGRGPPRELIGDTIARLNREADEAGEPRL